MKLSPLFFILILSASPAYVYGAQDVESAERLNMIRQATGGQNIPESSSSSFETRLNAIIDRPAEATDPARAYVAEEDARARQKINAAPEEELSADELAKKAEKTGSDTLKQKAAKKKQEEDDSVKLDSSEKKYLENMHKLQKEIDDEKENRYKPKKTEEEAAAAKGDPSKEPLALANNPFYFGENKIKNDGKRRFEEDKPIITSRLMQQYGFSRSDAEGTVNPTSSSEELIIALMQAANLTYGQASEMVRIDDSSEAS